MRISDWSSDVCSSDLLDGVRCIATKDGLFSRQGKPITSCPHISTALTPLFEHTPSLVLDGELYNHDLKDNFNEIISLVRKQKLTPEQFAETAKVVQYHVYDLPRYERFSLTRKKKRLNSSH